MKEISSVFCFFLFFSVFFSVFFCFFLFFLLFCFFFFFFCAELLSGCKLSAEEGITFLEHLADGRWDAVTVVGLASSLLSQLNSVRALAEQLRPKMADVRPEEIGDLIDQEMQATSEAIRVAEEKFHVRFFVFFFPKRFFSMLRLCYSHRCFMSSVLEEEVSFFQNLLEKSRADMTGGQLEVHERILDACTQLMSAIKVLVEKSKVLQREIVAEGRVRPFFQIFKFKFKFFISPTN